MVTKFCECVTDGYCTRYQRDMYGRMRELCAGINVDLGTAAAFRGQWARETVPVPATNSQHITLRTGQAPGDAVAMTAAIYSLHQAHPGKYTTSVESYWPDVFLYNPDVVSHQLPSNTLSLEMHYPAVDHSNIRGIHFMQGWCEFLGEALCISVPLLTNRPRLYFPDPEPITEDYWIVCSGGKKDFTIKQWHGYQQVVDLLQGKVKFVQVGGAKPVQPWHISTGITQEDSHPPLNGVENLVNQTSLRQLFELTRKAKGVLCGVSLMMHVAAALQKPAVVIAGAREPVQWNAYPLQHYMHSIGTLPCCATSACWQARVVPLGDGSPLDAFLCEMPINKTPSCMLSIQPGEIASLISRLNYRGPLG